MNLTSIPLGVIVLLAGLMWVQKHIKPPTEEELAEDEAKARADYRKAARRVAIVLGLRAILVLWGGGVLIYRLISGLGNPQEWGRFAMLLITYSIVFLIVQRAEANRRLATLLIMSLISLPLLSNYAAYQGWGAESNWALYGSLVLNYGFWLLIGRRYPPGSSQDIEVWGMDGA